MGERRCLEGFYRSSFGNGMSWAGVRAATTNTGLAERGLFRFNQGDLKEAA